ncbi:MAG: (d)CMP kinase [Chloroflexi bacterium]|nr:(d)CMP kinase [Chloroflexota bacterium]
MEEQRHIEGERLQKVLAEAGIASRRGAEELIRQGRVSVNGQNVTALGTRVGPDDEVCVDGQPVDRDIGPVYIVLHKPRGYISTVRDTHGRPSVLGLVPVKTRLFPMGRLDADSEGLILLTNDGGLGYQLTHPRHAIPKEYLVLVEGNPTDETLERLRYGVWLEEGPTAAAEVSRAVTGGEGVWLRIAIREGRKRQVRRMLAAVGHPVRRLVRTGIGPLKLGALPVGKWRFLKGTELAELRGAATEAAVPLVIAIDGPAASGKSALGQALAARLGWLHFDTGMLYRALTVLAHRRGIDVHDEDSVAELAHQARVSLVRPGNRTGASARVVVDGEDVTDELYTQAVDADVSAVAANEEVRRALLPRQRDIANQGRMIVVGRDIGTVVLPGAPLKVYLDASAEVRAMRRQQQFEANGQVVDREDLLADLRRRDRYDRERPNAPLAVADDAVVLHTDRMTLEEEVEVVMKLAKERFPALALGAPRRGG